MVDGAGPDAGATGPPGLPTVAAAGPVGAPPTVRLRPLGIGESLDAAIKIYRSRPRDMILAALVVTFPAVVLQVLVQLSAGDPQSLTETDQATGLVTVDPTATTVFLGGTLVSTLLLIVANNLALAGTMRISLAAYLGEQTTWRASLRFAFARFWPLTAVLAVSTVGILVGTLLCVAPGLWLQGIWAVAVPALLVEEVGPMASLGRSRHLVRGRFWPVLGAILLGALLASLLQSILVAPVLALQLVGGPFVVTSLLTAAAGLIGGALTTPFVAALTAVIYVDLRVRKEGFDLELMARGVGVDPGAEAHTGPLFGSAVAPAGPPVQGPVAPAGGWGRPAGPQPVPGPPPAAGPPAPGSPPPDPLPPGPPWTDG